MAYVATPPNAAATTAGIQTVPANSSWIAAFEYDAANLTLTTHLKDGAIYQHKMFLPVNWEDLKTAPNHSKHWSDQIRGKHASVRIRADKAPKSELKHKRR